MSQPVLRQRLARGDKIFSAWMSCAYPRMAEALGRAGFDAVTIDTQHGESSFAEMRDAITAGRSVGTPVGVRVGLEGFAEAARVLDVGAEFVVVPMINSVEDARRLVATLKYPPLGGRSWGPARALTLFGGDAETYRAKANTETIVLAMIETGQAADRLEAILDVPGLDGVFVGPSDLSISLSNGAALNPQSPETIAVKERVLAAAGSRGKITAIYSANGEAAARDAAMGFDIMAIGSDWNMLLQGAQATLASARKAP